MCLEKKQELASRLRAELKATKDPRVVGKGEAFDSSPGAVRSDWRLAASLH